MAGRFSTHRVVAPAIVPAIEEPAPPETGSLSAPPALAAILEPVTPASSNPLLTDKLLDAKVRLHRRLIEEINLSALEKLPEDEMRGHIQQLVGQYVVTERLAQGSKRQRHPH
jgi:pilus assembly protein CpaF